MGDSIPADRPRVIVSVMSSADGRVTLRRDRLLMDEDASRVWRSLQPPSAQALSAIRTAELDRLYHPEAILEGSGTFVTETDRPASELPAATDARETLWTDFLPAEVTERPGHERWFIVVDGRGRVRWEIKRDGGTDLLVLVARGTPAEYLAYLRREQIPYLIAGEHRVDLALTLRRIRGLLGVTCVVSEAGGRLNGALLRAGLVDEIQLLVVPAVIGGRDTPTIFDGPELTDGESPTRLRLLSAHAESDGMLWLRYDVVR
jgi:riboflavin biosynthesis pyrimidine reductase